MSKGVFKSFRSKPTNKDKDDDLLKDESSKKKKQQNQIDYETLFGLHNTSLQEDGPNELKLEYFDDPFFEGIKKDQQKKSEEDLKTSNTTDVGRDFRDKIKFRVDEKVFKEGFMMKEGRIRRNWKKRWFILNGPALNYYTGKNNKVRGSIPLESCTVRLATEKDRSDGKACLMLINNGISEEEVVAGISIDKQGDDDDDAAERVLFFDICPEDLKKNVPENLEQQRLEWLSAINSRIAYLQYQRRMKQLKRHEDPDISEFFIKGNSVTEFSINRELPYEGVLAIREPLKLLTNLKILNLSKSMLGDTGFQLLCDGLQQNESIKQLNLSECNIGIAGVKYFKKLLETPKYTSVDFSGNRLESEAVVSLSSSLLMNRSLTYFNISGNPMGDGGVQSYIEAILGNKHIQFFELNLSNTGMTDAACGSIGKLLASDYPIKTLHLSGNKIGNDGSRIIAQSLVKNKKLLVLNLEGNEIGYTGAKELAFMVVMNSFLETLVLGGNRLGEQALLLLGETNMEFPELEIQQK